MSTIKTFEEIEVWQKARRLTSLIYRISNRGLFAKDFALKGQIRKAGFSIMSNIAEGFERSGRKEFIQFLSIAKGSAGEVRSILYVAFDQEYFSKTEFDELLSLAKEIGCMIYGWIQYLKKTGIPGKKF
jgi:four helix bundle protein